MSIRKHLAALLAVAMLCGTFTACGGNSAADSSVPSKEASTSAPATEAPTTKADESSEAPAEVTEAETVDLGTPTAAASGQAYLAIADSQCWIQYNGNNDDKDYMLAYDAGVADITGNGQYTVSVTADTNGFRYDTTGNVDGFYTPSGCSLSAVVIRDGEKLFPNAIITIDSVVIDGKAAELLAKNYTCTEGGHIRSNIYQPSITAPSNDARSVDGYLYKNSDPSSPALADVDAYSAQIVDPSIYNSWTTVEVTFTVSGLDDAGQTAAEGETAAE